MVTVALAKENFMNICRVITDMINGAANEENFVEFDIPSENRSLTAGFPKWANYVKGVVACFHG
jgi:galactokinase